MQVSDVTSIPHIIEYPIKNNIVSFTISWKPKVCYIQYLVIIAEFILYFC